MTQPKPPQPKPPPNPDDTAVASDDDTDEFPRITPIFNTTPEPSTSTESSGREVPTKRSATGKPTGHVKTADLEAASHWDIRAWRRR